MINRKSLASSTGAATAALGLALCLSACEKSDVTDPIGDIPSKAEVEDAKTRVGLTTTVVGQGKAILEMLGIIPSYECGEARPAFASKLPASFRSAFAGANVEVNSASPTEDLISVAFPAAGSSFHGQTLTGNLLVKTSGGTDRFTLSLDARNVKVNNVPVQGEGGYGKCGDSTAYWAKSDGPVPGAATYAYLLNADVGKKAGIPIIGSTTLLINATATVSRSGKADQVVLTGIDYEVGKLVPRKGTVVINTSDNHRISATFSDDTPLVGQVEVKVDSKNAVKVPLPGF